jgi:hypothetical protein
MISCDRSHPNMRSGNGKALTGRSGPGGRLLATAMTATIILSSRTHAVAITAQALRPLRLE